MSTLQTSTQIQESNYEIRDILTFLCCSKNNQRCFLCFQTSTESVDIFLDFLITDGQNCYNKSIYILLAEIFRCNFRDILSNQVCNSCVDIILKIYKLLKKYENIKKKISLILKNLDKEIEVGSDNLPNDDTQGNLKLGLLIDSMQVYKPIRIGNLDSFISDKETKKDENFHCPQFDSHFKNFKSLEDNKKISSEISNDSKICETCGKACKSSALLKAHLNCHKVRKCPHCFKLLKAHAHFYYHVKKHLTGVKRHTRGNTVYRCDNCDYMSINKKSLEAHRNKEHLCVRPYTCDICSKGFYKLSHLVDHGRTHTKIKSDICHICGDGFVTKKCLKEHLRLHTGEKPYKCEQCDCSFVSASRRAEHIKSKHWDRSELCVTCGKTFSLKKGLDRHVKNVHAKDISVIQTSPSRDVTAENDNFN